MSCASMTQKRLEGRLVSQLSGGKQKQQNCLLGFALDHFGSCVLCPFLVSLYFSCWFTVLEEACCDQNEQDAYCAALLVDNVDWNRRAVKEQVRLHRYRMPRSLPTGSFEKGCPAYNMY
eukprot:2668970-Amphidinium_carterae.1